MKRAKKEQTDKEKIAIVDAIVQDGSYLEETLHVGEFIKSSKSSFGYKTIKCENEKSGYDKAFFKILKNDRAKCFFANYYRFLEIGEFKNGKLHGIGGIYLYDFLNEDQGEVVFLFGHFVDGLPDKELYYYSNDGSEFDSYILTDWIKGDLIAYFEDSNIGNINYKDIIIDSIFHYPYEKIGLRNYTYKEKQWWEKYQELYLINNRPEIHDRNDAKILRVNKFLKSGKYLKEKFISAPIKINSTVTFGHKEFEVNKRFGKFKGYDKGFYETLKNNYAKEEFAAFYRKIEIGEFKDGKLNGKGGRYLRDNSDGPVLIGLWGNFIDGLLHGRAQYLFESFITEDHLIYVYLSFWDMGKLIKLEKKDEEEALEIRNNDYFADPYECLNLHEGIGLIEEYENENIFLKKYGDDEGVLNGVDWWKEYKEDYQTWP